MSGRAILFVSVILLGVGQCPRVEAQEAARAPWGPEVVVPHARPTRPHAAPSEEVMDFSVDAPGRVTLLIESAGRAQHVSIERRLRESTTWTRDAPRNILGSGTCLTPCTLHVPPGPLVLRAEGVGLRDTDLRFDAPDYDARLRVRAPSAAVWNVGMGMVGVGSTMFVALAVLGILSQTSGGAELTPGPVIGLCTAGALLLGGGIPLLYLNTTGVERIQPLTRAD